MRFKGFNVRSKYKNKKVEVDGMKFDSKREYNRWMELQIMEKAGLISNLQRQVPFELIPKQKVNIQKGTGHITVSERSVKYIADFVYMQDGRKVVEDTKGLRTPEYVIKRKLLLYRYGLKVNEI